jgi:hypothetical protein
MAKQQARTRLVSTGICAFCEGEFDKSKMSQHLRHCKQRAAKLKAEESEPSQNKETIFHLVVEGRYRPQYWMHLEMPASATLQDLDDFLRDIWLECCGHLSDFEFEGARYVSHPEYEDDIVEEDEDEDEEEEDAEEKPVESLSFDELLAQLPPPIAALLPKERTPELEDFLRSYMDSFSYRSRFPEKRSMNVRLGKVLKAGGKFSYSYDFGSTTYLKLRVVSVREGTAHGDEDDDVLIMARNLPPEILCDVCKKPADYVVAEGFYTGQNDALCKACLKKRQRRFGEDEYDDYESWLPVVNSPRMGICAYGT